MTLADIDLSPEATERENLLNTNYSPLLSPASKEFVYNSGVRKKYLQPQENFGGGTSD